VPRTPKKGRSKKATTRSSRARSPDEYDAEALAAVAGGISRATLERCIRSGLCPQPSRTARKNLGGSPARFWEASSVAMFVAAAQESKRTGEAISAVMDRMRTNAPQQ